MTFDGSINSDVFFEIAFWLLFTPTILGVGVALGVVSFFATLSLCGVSFGSDDDDGEDGLNTSVRGGYQPKGHGHEPNIPENDGSGESKYCWNEERQQIQLYKTDPQRGNQ